MGNLGVDYFKNIANQAKGTFTTDADGNVIYISPDGTQTNYDSEAGLAQAVNSGLIQMVQPTLDLELQNNAADQYKLPSATEAAVSANNLATAQNEATTRLTPDQEAAQRSTLDLTRQQNTATAGTLDSWLQGQISGNNLTTAKNIAEAGNVPAWAQATKSGLDLTTGRNDLAIGMLDKEGASIGSGYDASTAGNLLSAADSTMQTGLVGNKGAALSSGYDLNTAQNQSSQRLVPYTEATGIANQLYQKAQAESGSRLTPLQEAATGSGLKYQASMNDGQNSLVPQRVAATGKFIDESMKGKSVVGAMNEASADVGMAYKGAQDARRRNMSRMGVMPSLNSMGDNSLDMARLNVGARASARRTTEDDNYRKLGAVALMP